MGLLTAIVALAYGGLGWLALTITAPLSYAAPLYPPAGLALAVAMVHGRRALPGVWLGAFAVNVWLGWQGGLPEPQRLIAPLLIGGGAALQAGVGAELVRRLVSQPVLLNEPRDILRFSLVGALLADLCSPTVATTVLFATGSLGWNQAASNWLTWWVGDTMGTLIMAPLVLAFIGLPAADWRPRRRTLALPLGVAMALLAAGLLAFWRLDQQRLRATFDGDADRLASEAQARLAAPLNALQALHGSSRGRSGMDAETLHQAARWWLSQPIQLQAMGYSERVPLDALPAFEARARQQGATDYRVFDRDAGAARAGDGEVVALRYIEPLEGNAMALGVNALSVPAARVAILESRDSAQPAATGGFTLSQSEHAETGMVIYQALYSGEPTNLDERRAQFRGVVFVTLRTEGLLQGLAQPTQQYLRWCLVDADLASAQPRLAGPAGCENAQGARNTNRVFRAWRQLNIGGRPVELRIVADVSAVPGEQREASGLLAVSGLAAAALLGALLLTVTGHSRRTEIEVLASTAVLRREMAERAQAEAALRESESRLRSILDHVPLGVMFLDPNGLILEGNPRLSELLGLSADRLRGKSVLDLVLPDEVERLRGLRRSLLSSAAVAEVDRLPVRAGPQGQMRVMRATASALRGADGTVQRMVCVLEDVTETLQLEVSEQARTRAESASLAKSEFVSRMSHELRTPLNAMLGFAQLMNLDRKPPLAAHQTAWTQQIQRAGWHLLELIDETLELARIEAGGVQVTLAPVALKPLIDSCLDLVAGEARERGIQIGIAIDADAQAVMADGLRLKQVLTNLLSNGIKYNRPSGGLTLNARRVAGAGRDDPDALAITVSDTGLGMTPEQLAVLFQPYNRLGRETSGIAGSGIGLSISRGLAELMGGTLQASSEAGLGSIFTLQLPAADSASAPAARYSDTHPAPYDDRRVLYIEDNETNIEVMRGIFAQRPQVHLQTALLGREGLAAMAADPPDLLLLDMQLPDISGMDVLRAMKADPLLAAVPVLVVSADATDEQVQAARAAGARHYVTKPVDLAPFLVLVDSILDDAAAVPLS